MHRIPLGLAPFLYVPGLVFEALVRVRGRLYSADLLPQHRLPGPVISVGNITMGGAGKTPLVIHVAQALAKLGFHPAVLSRGYGRRNSNDSKILPPGENLPFPALTIGDEPALIRRHIPSAWMGISKDRFKAGSSIARQQVRVAFLLDDGFQHRNLHRDLDIVIVDRSQPLRANCMFPRGTLREPASELRRCHVIVVNGTSPAESPDPVEAEIRNLHVEAPIFHCDQSIGSLVPLSSWQEGRADSAGPIKSAYVVTAVGNPERFQRDIRRLGIEVRGASFFADHYWIKEKDWRACGQNARSKAADAIVITEKDAVKITEAPDFPLLVSIQSTRMSEPGAFENILKHCIEERM